MSKVQSAISYLITSVGAGIGLVKGIKKSQEKEKALLEKEQAIATREAEKTARIEAKEKEQEAKQLAKEKGQEEDALEVAKRVALTRLNVGKESQEAYLLAEKMGTLKPRIRMRGQQNELLPFTAGTTARRMADINLAGATYSKALTDASYRQQLLSMGKTNVQRAKNVLIAEKGGKV